MDFKALKNGLITGLFFQLALGPVFFFIVNLTLQKTIYDGFAGALAATIADFTYITLALLGIGKLLEKKKTRKLFGILSSIILVIFGLIIINSVLGKGITTNLEIGSSNVLSSFLSVLILTLSSPITIVFYTSIFTARAIEYNYKKKQLYTFGFAVGLTTLIFMSLTVIIFSIFQGAIPRVVIQILNLMVGVLLIGYGVVRMVKILTKRK